MGGIGYKLVQDVLIYPDDIILEIGSDRGEGSTWYLAEHAVKTGSRLVTIDIDPNITSQVSKIVSERKLPVSVIEGDATQILIDWRPNTRLTRFAYLDGWDYPYDNMNSAILNPQIQRYRERKQALTKQASADHHLALVVQLNQYIMASNSIIVIDDTWRDSTNTWQGKGARAIPYLLNEDWVIHDEVSPLDAVWESYVAVINRAKG